MQTNQHLLFLQQKIQELGHAIFYNLSDSLLKFPTALISDPQVDDYGFVWFWVPRPKQSISEFENGFPVRLDFYRKGKTCFLQVSGKAWVVTDPEEMYSMPGMALHTAAAMAGMVLVKVKMLRAEYHETATASRQSWWSTRKQALGSWFRQASGGYTASHTYYPAS